MLSQISFWLFGGLMIAGALGVVFSRSIVYSALALLVAFLSIAGVFVILNAPFIAAAQILVYGVGLTIVLIFGIMLTGDHPFVDPVGHERPKKYWLLPAITASLFLGVVTWALLNPNSTLTDVRGLFAAKLAPAISMATLDGARAIRADGGITMIGQMLFSQYLVPFELASILLLLAMIGAIILSKRELPEEEGEVAILSDSPHPELTEDVSPVESLSLKDRQDKPDVSKTLIDESEKETLGVH